MKWLVFPSLFLLFAQSVQGLPEGFVLQAGEAVTPSVEADQMVIQSGSKAHIDWQSFNIAKQEKVHFQQADSSSYVLNRVVGEVSSEIAGQLFSNGAVYLVNPYGILIGKEALLETAGFIASTLDLFDNDMGKLVFQGESLKEVVHEGVIHCAKGDVFLIGRKVENRGTILTPEGRQGLISAPEVWIVPKGAPQVLIRAQGPLDPVLLDENPYAYAIRHSGRAQGKEVYFDAGSGLCSVENSVCVDGEEQGGVVQILGDRVHVLPGATIAASGKAGGGTVLIGGDYQGKNSAVHNAKVTWVGSDTFISADAREKGNGGKVILWGDEATFHYGEISVRGGEEGGDGGFVEISAHNHLEPKGQVDAQAVKGQAGTLLLDPNDAVIDVLATTGTFSACVPPVSYQFVAGTATNQILNTDLQTQLGSCNVTISTVGTGGAGPNNGSIIVNSPVTWATANTLTLTASSYIVLASTLTNNSASTGFTAVSMTANGTGATTNPGISLNLNGIITTNGGDVVLSGTSDTVTTGSHGVSFNGGTINTTSGNVTVNGIVASGVTGAAKHGISMATTNGITSSTGRITLSGTTNTTGSSTNSCGVNIANSWTTGTSGDLVFTNCQSVNTIGGVGLGIFANLSTVGNLIATNSIIASRSGVDQHAAIYAGTTTISSTGGGNILLTGTMTGGAGFSNGGAIYLNNVNASVTGNGNITAIGYANGMQLNNGSCAGLIVRSGTITAQNGDISLAGFSDNTSVAGYLGVGCFISPPPVIQSTGGNIIISGVSQASERGVYIQAGTYSALAGSIQFGAPISGIVGCQASGTADGLSFGIITNLNGNVFCATCVGGSSGGNGIHLTNTGATATVTCTGNFVATNTIQGGAGGGVGFFVEGGRKLDVTGSGSGVTIFASGASTPTTGTCHGILISAGTVQTSSATGGSITLQGTGGNCSTASHGVSISGTGLVTTSANSATITLSGTGGNGSGGGFGVNLAASTNSVTSGAAGTIVVSGTGSSNATPAGSHGVSISTNSWTPGNGGLLAFATCIGGAGTSSNGVNFSSAFTGSGDVSFANCVGGTGSGGTGININAAFTTTGSITGTNTIQGGGAAGVGITVQNTLVSSGSGKTISLTASGTSSSTSGACHGISVVSGGIIRTSSASGSTITLIGTGGDSSTASHGITITGTGLVDSSANNVTMSLTGTGGNGTGGGDGINLASSNDTLGPITLTGIGSSNSSASNSYGVSVNTNTWTPGTSSLITFSSCVGGAGANSDAVNFASNFSGSGNVAFTNCARGSGSGNFAINFNSPFTTTGSVAVTSSTPSTSTVSFGSSLSTLTANSFSIAASIPSTLNGGASTTINTSGANGAISFGGTIDGTATYSQALTLNAGTGPITCSQHIGDNIAIGAFSLTGGIINLSTNVTALNLTANNSGLLTLAGTFNIAGVVSQVGTGLVDLNGTISTFDNNISFNRGVTLLGTSNLDTGGTAGVITFSSTLDGGFGLTLDGQSIVFSDMVGSTTPLASLQATAATGGTIAVHADQVVSSGPMTYAGNVVLFNPVHLTDSGTSGMTFAPPSGTAILGNFNLTLRATNSFINVSSGDVILSGSSGTSGGNLSATAATGLTFGGQVLAMGGVAAPGAGGNGGNVTLSCTNDSVSFHNINVSGAAGTVSNGSGGDITIQPSSAYSNGLPVGIIQINSDLSSGGDGNLVSLAGGGGASGGTITLSANRSAFATVATIASSSSGNDINIAANTCTMGAFEALTALGNVTFVCSTLTLGDTVALDNLSILATTVNLNTHGNISLLNNLGNFYTSPSLHFLGGSGYAATGTFVPAGAALNAQNLNLSSSAFRPLLLNGSTVLNYDTTYTPGNGGGGGGGAVGAGNITPLKLRQKWIYELLIADAQLSDLLPLFLDPLPDAFFLIRCDSRRSKDGTFEGCLQVVP